MSGIVGLYNLNHQRCQPQQLKAMTEAIAHRGPDGQTLWCDGPIGLGHCMLRTTPESLVEQQPLINGGTDWRTDWGRDDRPVAPPVVLTADARIDNRDELLQQLHLDADSGRTMTDSQLILSAYQQWGTACVRHLVGDFAFALWDGPRQQLFCARDHLGVKPFYYHYAPDTLLVLASELKAILTVPGVPQQISEARLRDFLALNFEDQVATTYQKIHRIPPAHWMVVDRHGFHVERYWQLDPDAELHLASDDAYAQRFRDLFIEAVRCRVRSAFPVGSHLSGGLDSSSVTVVARELLAKDVPLHTFSCVFDDLQSCDERPYIEAVLAKGGLTSHILRGDRLGPLSDIDTILAHEDEALPGPNYYFPWHLNMLAQQADIRILLDGHDGDTVVSHGLYRLTELARAQQWEALVLEAKAIANTTGSSAEGLVFFHGGSTLQDLSRRLRWRSLLRAFRAFHRHLGLSRKRLLWQVGVRPLLRHWISRFQSPSQPAPSSSPPSPQSVREHHWQALTSGVFTYVLEQSDRCAAAFGLEARHPFLDKRLVEFCLAIPSTQKMAQGWGRLVMRRAMTELLPECIQWRGDKANLTPNFSHGLLQVNRARLEQAMEHLPTAQTYLSIDLVQDAYQKLMAGHDMTSSERMSLWQGIVLTLWLHRQRNLATLPSDPSEGSRQAESGASLVETSHDVHNTSLEVVHP